MATISTIAKPAYVYDQTADTWYPVGAQAIAFVQTFEYTATAGQTTFTGIDDNGSTLSYTEGAVRIYLNGVLLTPSTDYVASNGTSVILSVGASLGDILVIIASETFQIADTYSQSQVNLLLDGKVSKSGGDTVTASSSSIVPLTLKGASSQTANLLTIEDNGGTDLVVVNPSGNVGIGATNPTTWKLEVAGIVEADNYDIGLTTVGSDSIALNFSGETGLYTRTAAGNITFTASNYRVGSIKTVRIIPGASSRNLTFPASWVFVGTKPTSVAANKTGILTITSFGTTEADCVAAWAVQA